MEDADGFSEPPSPSSPGSLSVTPPSVEIALDAAVCERGAVSENDRAWLVDRARAAGSVLNARGECRVRIVADEAMASLHGRWLGEPTTTDVMTFDLSEGDSARTRELDCDLVVCLDEAQRRAEELGHGTVRELLLYIVHGMLHCLGHDDTDEQNCSRMHAEEDRVLEAIGVGATFGHALDRSVQHHTREEGSR